MSMKITYAAAVAVTVLVGAACGYDDRAGNLVRDSASAAGGSRQAAGGAGGVDTAGGRVTTAPESSLAGRGAATTGDTGRTKAGAARP